MKEIVFKSGWLIVFFLVSFTGKSQTETGLLPFSNKLLLNSSFAGMDRNQSVWSNLLFSSEPDNGLIHSYTVTYDKWSDNLKGGLGFYFYQGLNGKENINHTGAGFSISKPITMDRGHFIPSFNLNNYLFTKQWQVFIIDGIVDKEKDPYNPPGISFKRYNILNPRFGLLINSPSIEIGTSASYLHQYSRVQEDSLKQKSPVQILFHAAKKIDGHQKGLLFRPFKASPEVVVIYSENLLVSRAGFRMEQVDHLLGFFVQNNFTNKHHGIAGIYGWRLTNFRIAFTLGGAYSIPSSQTMFFGEASLGLVIPYKFQNEINPWAPAFINF